MSTLKKVLILTADDCDAQFYIANGPHNLTKLSHLFHYAGRLHEHDLTSKEHDVNTCPYEGSIKKEHGLLVFSKEIISRIEKYLAVEKIKDVCIFAAPKFLGILKKHNFNEKVHITGIAKDFIHNNQDISALEQAIKNAGLSFISEGV